MAQYRYTVIFDKLAEGGYNVIVPAIPEICTHGETLEEARAMAADAIKLVIEDNLASGEPIPQEIESSSEKLAVTVP